MMRLLNFIAIFLVLSFSFGLYKLKYQTSITDRSVNELKAELAREEELVHVLRAEWNYLNRSERIQKLAEEKLPNLEPVKPIQIMRLTDIPFRPLTLEELIEPGNNGSKLKGDIRFNDVDDNAPDADKTTGLPRGGNANG